MTHRISIAISLAAFAAMSVLAGPAAMADPTPRQPAQVRLPQSEARYYARMGANAIAAGLVQHQKARLGKCSTRDHRRVWTCPAIAEGSETVCTMTVWVWGDRRVNRYYEYHDLRCADRL